MTSLWWSLSNPLAKLCMVKSANDGSWFELHLFARVIGVDLPWEYSAATEYWFCRLIVDFADWLSILMQWQISSLKETANANKFTQTSTASTNSFRQVSKMARWKCWEQVRMWTTTWPDKLLPRLRLASTKLGAGHSLSTKRLCRSRC